MPLYRKGVHSISKATDALLYGDVTLSAGSQIALTQTGQDIEVATSGLVIGTDVQAWDANLDQIAALTPTDNNFIVGNGSAWTLETPSDVRTSLGLIAGGTGDIWVEKAGDTMTGALTISAAATGLTVDNDAVVSGNLAVGAAISSVIGIRQTKTFTGNSTINGIQSTSTWQLNANSSSISIGINATLTIDQNGFDATSTLATIGSQNRVTVDGSSGTVTGATGANYQVVNTGGGVVTRAVGAFFQNNVTTGGGSITNSTGVNIVEQTGGTTNNTNLVIGQSTQPTGAYSIYNVSTRDNYFGGSINVRDAIATTNVDLNLVDSINGDYQARFRNISTGTSARVFFLFGNDAGSSGYLMLTGSNYTGVSGWADRYIFNSDTVLTGGILMRPGAGGFQVSANGTNNPNLYVAPTTGRVGVGTLNPQQVLDVRGIIYSLRYGSQGTIRCASANGTEASPTALVASDLVGQISFDGTYDTSGTFGSGADILVATTGNWTSSSNLPSEATFRLNTGSGLVERMAMNSTEFVHNDTGIDYDFRVEGDTQANLLMVDASTDRVGINIAAPTGKLDIDQSSTTGAIPVLQLDQADVSEEFISFLATIGTGNSIEAVGAKTLTTTHFMKVKIQGGLIRYFPVGTIA